MGEDASLPAFLDLLPEPALWLDARGHPVAWNRPAASAYGAASAGRGEGTRWARDLAAAVNAVPAYQAWLGGRRTELFRGHLPTLRPNGVPVTCELRARPVPGEPGGTLCLLVEFDREEVAKLAQRYFDIAFDAAPIGMAVFNTDGEYVRVNAALSAMLDRSSIELLGRRDQEFTHPDDRQRDVDAAWRILRGEIHTWQCEKRAALHRRGASSLRGRRHRDRHRAGVSRKDLRILLAGRRIYHPALRR